MIAYIGDLALVVMAVSAVLMIIRGVAGMRSPSLASARRLMWPAIGVVGSAFVAMSVLEIAILLDNFSIEYIANYSATETPFIFKVAAGWGALEGSILLWAFVLAVFVGTVYRQHARRTEPDPLGAGALAVLGGIVLFFAVMMLTVANPFRVCVEAANFGCFEASNWPWASAMAAIVGRGPNPLLQNSLLMAVHPPFLYIGYVGMAVPFAYAMSALMTGTSGVEWLRRTRSWTLVAWSFLTIGIVAGGLWSYEVLGWGGFWAWDPVENASFMPWLVATAFLHSAVVQERRGMLQAWNFVLVITGFALTILGTFLTRSGIINSVHSFTQSAVGPVLLWFMMVVLVASFGLFVVRARLVGLSPRLDSLASREGVFMFNNLLLSVYTFVVLVGTLYPMFSEAFTGTKVGVGRPFFDRLAIPLSFGLLLAMGVGPITPYRKAKGSVVWSRIKMPVRLALGAAAIAVVFQHRSPLLLISIFTATFVILAILRNLSSSAAVVAEKKDFSRRVAVLRVMSGDPGYWGGQIAHMGVAVVALGIALSSALSIEATIALAPGETATVAGYDVKYAEQINREEGHRFVNGAQLEVSRDLQILSVQEPALNKYPGTRESVAKPAVYESLVGDLYFSLKSVGPEGIVLGVWWFPFIWLVWFGGFLTGLSVLWSRLVKKPERAPRGTPQPTSVGVSDGR